MTKPLVIVPSDTFEVDGFRSYKCGDKYLRALTDVADVTPLIIPAMDDTLDLDSLLSRVDGVMLSGGVANVHPSMMAERFQDLEPVGPFDPHRDGVTIELCKRAIDKGKPLMGICRGLQELNVALGGSLYPLVHEADGFFDHRRKEGTIDVEYGPHHEVNLEHNGLLASWINEQRFMINSLHWQGVDELGSGLVAEAKADDGFIEAASLPGAKALTFGVQWHPEFRASENKQSIALFKGFRQGIDAALTA